MRDAYLEVHIIKIRRFEIRPEADIRKTAHTDDAGTSSRGEDLWHEQVGEEEVADMIGAELELDAVHGCRIGLDRCHCRAISINTSSSKNPGKDSKKVERTASVVNQHIQLVNRPLNLCCRPPHARQIAQIQSNKRHLHIRVISADLIDDGSDLGFVAAGKEEVCRGAGGEGEGGSGADSAGGGACYEDLGFVSAGNTISS